MLLKASNEFSHLEEHARFLDSKAGASRFGGLVGSTLASRISTPLNTLEEGTEINKDTFKDLLSQIDKGLRALPATAQVANQQGKYLASVFVNNTITGEPATTKLPNLEAFKYNHKVRAGPGAALRACMHTCIWDGDRGAAWCAAWHAWYARAASCVCMHVTYAAVAGQVWRTACGIPQPPGLQVHASMRVQLLHVSLRVHALTHTHLHCLWRCGWRCRCRARLRTSAATAQCLTCRASAR